MTSLREHEQAVLKQRDPVNVRCGACSHVWTAAYTPMEMMKLARLLKAVHCPACGETGKNIFMAKSP